MATLIQHKEVQNDAFGINDSETKYNIKSNTGNTEQIQNVAQEKDLGVIFDPKLTFSQHVNEKVKKANGIVGLINKNFHYMSKDMFLILYKALVRPHLEYASPIWSPRFKKDRLAVENVQRRATRIVKELSHLNYNQRIRKLGLPSLEYRRNRADLLQTYKIMNNIDRIDKHRLFPTPPPMSQSTRGNTNKIFVTHSRTQLRRATFSQRIFKPWNSLPDKVVQASSLNSFKIQLNDWVGGPCKFSPECVRN